MSAVRSESEKKITLFFSSLEWGPQVKRKSKTAFIDQIFPKLAGKEPLKSRLAIGKRFFCPQYDVS